jgi:hypothetical protein
MGTSADNNNNNNSSNSSNPDAPQHVPRRSSRAVAKPDFRAMENYGDLTSEYGDDLFQVRDDSQSLDPDRQDRSGILRQVVHARRPSGGSGSGARGMKKVAGGNATKVRRMPAVEEMEAAAKKLEQDVSALQSRRVEVRSQLEAILRENEALRSELGARGTGGEKKDEEAGRDGGLLYF